MCSFLLVNQLITNLAFVNFYLHPRGPDATTHTQIEGFDFVHNLLHMTGDMHPQPFLDGRAVALFNGEIYNWRSFGEQDGTAYRSDGEVILPAYRRLGQNFVRALHGEFAIAVLDFENDIAVLATDAFGTKPLWYALIAEENRFAVATYKSALLRLDFPASSIRMVGPNCFLTIQLSTFTVRREASVFEFDLRQHKQTTDDFVAAFEKSIKIRTDDLIATKRSLFVGLSSGFDSGAIHAALHLQDVKHHAFALLGEEVPELLDGRAHHAWSSSEVSVVMMSHADFEAERQWLSQHAEPCAYLGTNFTGQEGVLDDHASVGLSYIVRLSRDRGALCYLSGTGADEILSDYGFQGEKLCPQSSFGGLFPEDLSEVFPWAEFFLSTQRDYLFKEEHVAGAHGVEARYPFLDTNLVQEFIWLAPEVKNREYKVGLHDAFVRWGYPFEKRKKQGFAAMSNLLPSENSLLWRYHALAEGVCGLPPPTPSSLSGCSASADGIMRCEARCVNDQPPVADTLRCGHHGAWVGRMVCELDRADSRSSMLRSRWRIDEVQIMEMMCE
mmetsp:Transcript_168743/g.542301  ORF Transcript_168743/g.542301 Transcript_168743/m.542301 type:complete len:556 (+) Transcript_168743:87-1754(+)